MEVDPNLVIASLQRQIAEQARTLAILDAQVATLTTPTLAPVQEPEPEPEHEHKHDPLA